MLQPAWNTPSGNLGSFTENKPLTLQFSALPSNPNNTLQYSLLNGSLPNSADSSLVLNQQGTLTGTPTALGKTYTTVFTIRLKEFSGTTQVGFKDRTFSITINGESVPRFTATTSLLGTYQDSTWIDIQLLYQNPTADTTIDVSVVDGTVPPGLKISSTGRITGYAAPPTNSSGAPVHKTYELLLKISNGVNFSVTVFLITIQNQQLLPSFSGRRPVLMNINPSDQLVSSNPDLTPYILQDSNIGIFQQNSEFQFKLIGYDFDDDDVEYAVAGLELLNAAPYNGSIALNVSTGWLSGTLPNVNNQLTTFSIQVVVEKATDATKRSTPITLSLSVNGNISPYVEWITPSDLGEIPNSTISDLFVAAESAEQLQLRYTLDSGTLPPGLRVLESGEISGRVAFQSSATLQSKNAKKKYTFSIRATGYDPVTNTSYSFVTATREFTLTTVQEYTVPYDSVYIQAYPQLSMRRLYNQLVENQAIFEPNLIYRPSDPYYGVSKKITVSHAFGIPSNLTDRYIAAASKNHYVRDIILGPLRTAVAKNQNGTVLYEVVYSEIIDDLVNNQGKSISKQILWPEKINGQSRFLYPASLENMQDQIYRSLGSITDSSVLPLWMRSIQPSGSTVGFISAFVLCYTKPGCSSVIKNNIEMLWDHKLNEIQFTIDRFIIDRSMTYQYNPVVGQWETLPTDVLPSSTQQKNARDSIVFFNRNILDI